MQALTDAQHVLSYACWEGDDNKPMLRRDGTLVEYVTVVDPGNGDVRKITMVPTLAEADRPEVGSMVQLDLLMRVDEKPARSHNGYEYVARKEKLTVQGFKPAPAAVKKAA